MNFSVEEENLICMYHTSDRRRTMARSPLTGSPLFVPARGRSTVSLIISKEMFSNVRSMHPRLLQLRV